MEKALMQTYDKIAKEYKGYRRAQLPTVKKFLSSSKSPLLDIGCSNLAYLKDYKRKIIGIDFSLEFLKQSNSNLLIQADAAELPIKSNSFKYISMIATLHHLPTESERLMALLEIKRILKKGGRAIITVWKRYQRRFFPKSLLTSDIEVPFGKYTRFYHLFTEKELRKLIKTANLKILKLSDVKGNLVVIAGC